MKLLSIDISRYAWEVDGKLKGKIKFAGEASEIEIQLSEAQISGVLAVVASGIVAAAQEVACNLTAEVIEAAGKPQALSAPVEEVPAPADDMAPF